MLKPIVAAVRVVSITATIVGAAQPGPTNRSPAEPETLALSAYSTEEVAGFKVLVHPEAPAAGMTYRRVRAGLLVDLETIASRVPPAALAVLRESAIVITPRSPAREGYSGRGMCFHESAAWLTENGFDAAREGTVEICNMEDFLEWRAEQPMMVLHELAHAYHWRIGFNRPDIIEAYAAARDAGLYKAVPYALSADGETREAYAMVNAKEYFAELSEAYFGRNDYFPFTRDALRTHDPSGYAVVERLWGLGGDRLARERPATPNAP